MSVSENKIVVKSLTITAIKITVTTKIGIFSQPHVLVLVLTKVSSPFTSESIGLLIFSRYESPTSFTFMIDRLAPKQIENAWIIGLFYKLRRAQRFRPKYFDDFGSRSPYKIKPSCSENWSRLVAPTSCAGRSECFQAFRKILPQRTKRNFCQTDPVHAPSQKQI